MTATVAAALAVAGLGACADRTGPVGPTPPPSTGAAEAPPPAETVTPRPVDPVVDPPEADADRAPWGTPRAFRSFVADLQRPGPGIQALAAAADDQQLLALAELICGRIEPDMSTAELGAAALATGAELTALAPDLRADEGRLA
ncbi:MAG: hypothetical protein AAFN30_04450, partial [Actinomycetota bacterium]